MSGSSLADVYSEVALCTTEACTRDKRPSLSSARRVDQTYHSETVCSARVPTRYLRRDCLESAVRPVVYTRDVDESPKRATICQLRENKDREACGVYARWADQREGGGWRERAGGRRQAGARLKELPESKEQRRPFCPVLDRALAATLIQVPVCSLLSFTLILPLLFSPSSPSPPTVNSSRMQRRAGKAVAHINVPSTPVRMGSDAEKSPSRLHQKSLGVTNRIWLILVAFVALILFTRSILPTDSSNSRHRLLHTDLKPKNYLNVSDDANPFPFCPALGPGDELASKYDPIILSQTRFHTGSGARIQRVIHKALAGLPVTISVIGGSGKHVISYRVSTYLRALLLLPLHPS